MEGRNIAMQAIFSELSERNKDIVILVAKSIRVAQDVAEQATKSYSSTRQQAIKPPEQAAR